MKAKIGFILSGVFFGFVLIKAEVVSWYRIVEMFRFEAFHMYGIILSAIIVGAISIQILKKINPKSIEGDAIKFSDKDTKLWKSYLIGGTIFGLGWGLTGACPGPLFALFGAGNSIILVPIISAIAGTWVYGKVRAYLPH